MALIQRLCIIGVGLIGGSLALALKKQNAVRTIVGCSRNEGNLKKAVSLGVIDEYELEIADAVKNADVVVVAVPVNAMGQVFAAMASHLPPACVVTDVGSAKSAIIQEADKHLGDAASRFVPGHPIAGTEHSGVDAAFDSLFNKRKVLLTPSVKNDAQHIELINKMWSLAGAEVQEMEPQKHDEILALTSHLPHMLAFTFMHVLTGSDFGEKVFQYAAGGYRDFSRIASSDPAMWRDICLHNRDAILEAINAFQSELTEIRTLIENADAEGLHARFGEARQAREKSLTYLDEKSD